MSNLGLSQRIWQIADEAVQRALEALANTYDAALRTLNKAFDFTDSTTTVRNSLSVLGNTTAQNVAAATVSTPGGFKSVVGPWQRSQATLATTPTALVWGADSNATGASGLMQGYYPTHPGSIVGMQLAGQAGSTTTTVTAVVYKNQVATAAQVTLALSAAGTSFSTATFGKGAVPFNATDRLDVYYVASAGNTGQIVAAFTLEMSA